MFLDAKLMRGIRIDVESEYERTRAKKIVVLHEMYLEVKLYDGTD